MMIPGRAVLIMMRLVPRTLDLDGADFGRAVLQLGLQLDVFEQLS
jgi:hypothetical protein